MYAEDKKLVHLKTLFVINDRLKKKTWLECLFEENTSVKL